MVFVSFSSSGANDDDKGERDGDTRKEREREMTRTVKRVVLSIFRRQFHLLVF